MKQHKPFARLTFLLIACCLNFTAYGQKDKKDKPKIWETKPYQEWTKKEAEQILTASPWASNHSFEIDISSEHFTIEPLTVQRAIARLRSALPLRQAFVRRKQLSIKYDKLKADKKADFDAEVKEFLECAPCAKYYIVTLELFNTSYLKAFEKSPEDKREAHVFLINDKGERRNLVHLRRENDEILFFFQRVDEQGKPFLTIESKGFYLIVDKKKLFEKESLLLLPTRFTFLTSGLIQNGEIVF